MPSLTDLLKLLPAEYVPIFIAIAFGAYVTLQVRKSGPKPPPPSSSPALDPHSEWRDFMVEKTRLINHNVAATLRHDKEFYEYLQRMKKEQEARFDRLEAKQDRLDAFLKEQGKG